MRGNKGNREGLILLLVVGIAFLFGSVGCEKETKKETKIKVEEDIYIVKLDSSGNVKGTIIISIDVFDYANSIIQSSDGGYVVAGYIGEYGSDVYVVKLDSEGKVQWEKTIGGGSDDKANSIIQSSDGGYVVAGYIGKYGSDVYVVKLDPEGKVQWEKIIDRGSDDKAYSIIQSSDGGYVVAGYTRDYREGDSDIYIMKLDSKGKVRWERTIGGGSDDKAYSIIQSSDGGYVVAGYTRDYREGDSDIYIMKLDSKGKVRWERTIGGGSDDKAYSIIQSSDGGYVVAGYIGEYGSDVYVVKLDSEGKVQWEKTIGGGSDDKANSIIQSSDGGYVVAGYTRDYREGDIDIYIVKLDSEGKVQWEKTIGGGLMIKPIQ